MGKWTSVSEYIAAQPDAVRSVLRRVRAIIRKALPNAEEVISYQIPAYKLHGSAVLYFAGWKQHYSLYPVGAALVTAFKAELAPYKVTKGTIRFPLDGPLPAKLIERIAKFRAKEAAERVKAKGSAPRKRRKRQMPKFTKPPDSLVAVFGRAIEDLPGVQPRTMFGYPAAFVNGNMFSCLFQSSMIVRLSEEDRTVFATRHGARPFEPTPGRGMREYMAVPDEILGSPKLLDVWLRKSHAFAAALPAKAAGKKVAGKKTAARAPGRR